MPRVVPGVIKDPSTTLSDAERKGLARAGYACLAIIALWVFLTIGPGTPLINEDANPEARLTPMFQSLVAGFFFLFLGFCYCFYSC